MIARKRAPSLTSHPPDHEPSFSETFQEPPSRMMRVLKFLAGIKPDQTGFSFTLPRTIQRKTRLPLRDFYEIIEEAEGEVLVSIMRTNLSEYYMYS